MKIKETIKFAFMFLILQAGNTSLLYSMQEQENAPQNQTTPRLMYMLKPTPKAPKPEDTFQFNNRQELENETKRNTDEFQNSLKQTFKTILEINRPVLIENLKLILKDPVLLEETKKFAKDFLQDKELMETGSNSAKLFLNSVLKDPELAENAKVFLNTVLADPVLSQNLKGLIKNSLSDPEVASAAKIFIENAAGKSILSTKNLFILLWIIPAVKATKDLAPYIVKYLSKAESSEKIQWNKIINNKHSKLLSLAMVGIASSPIQAFITEKLFQCTKWTIKEVICLSKALYRTIN